MRFIACHRSMPAFFATAAIVLAAAVAPAADAADRGQQGVHRAQHAGQKARPHGDYTRHTEVRRTDTGHSRTDTWSGERGTATRTEVTQRTDDGYSRSSTATGTKGGTTTRDVTAVRDPSSGTWTRDVKVDRTPPPKADGG